MAETATEQQEEKKKITGKDVFDVANTGLQMTSAVAGAANSAAELAGHKNDGTDLTSGITGLLASGTGTVAAGMDIAENSKDLKELNEKISELEKKIKDPATDPNEKTQLEKELENAKGKRSELRIGNVKSGNDAVSGLAGMVSSGAGFDDGDAAEKTGSISDIVGGAAGTASGGLGMWQAWKKRKRRLKKHEGNAEKEKSIKSKFWKEMAGGAMGTLGGLLGAGSGIASLMGSETLSSILGLGSNLIGMGGSFLDMFGGGKKEKPKQAADAAQTAGDTPAPAPSETPAPAQSDSTPSETPTQQEDPRASAGEGAA